MVQGTNSLISRKGILRWDGSLCGVIRFRVVMADRLQAHNCLLRQDGRG